MRRLAKIVKPRGSVFFDLFEAAAKNMVQAAELLEQMLADYPARAGLADDIRDRERDGDRITHDLTRELHTTFVTPIDRDDILALTSSIDDIVDFTEEVSDFMGLYRITGVLPEARQLTSVLTAACRQLADALTALRDLRDLSVYTVEVHRLENEGDRIVRAALAALFASGVQTLDVVRWKDVLERLEQAIDATEHSASIIEGIVLKNS